MLAMRTERVGDARPRELLDALVLATLSLANHSRESWGLIVRGRPELGDEPNRRARWDTLSPLRGLPQRTGINPENLAG